MKIDPFAVAIMALLATNVVEGKRKEKGGGGLRKWRDQHKNKPHKGGGGGGGGGRKHRQKCSATIAVANRASGTVSVLDAESGGLRATIDLPGNAEPMYVSAINGLVFVGDRRQNRIVVMDATNGYEIIKLMPAGNGIFHQCVDQAGTVLWVNNDIDNTIAVYDIVNLQAIKTIPIPADITAVNGKPHDMSMSFDGRFAFVTCLGQDAGNGIILKYDVATYELVARRDDLKGDPHVSLTWRNNKLYVAQQDGGVLSFLDQGNLTTIAPDIPIPDAHGTLMASAFDDVFFVSDISDAADGEVGLYAIDFDTDKLLGKVTTNIPPTPHNIVGTGQAIFVTHSGATNDLVTMYSYSKENPVPLLKATTKVGLNPFGLDFVETTCPTDELL